MAVAVTSPQRFPPPSRIDAEMRRRPRGRSVEITETGAAAFKHLFGARI